MRSVASAFRVSAAALLVLPLAATPAWAYLDPGTGSMLVQLLIGGVAGSLFIIKLYYGRLKSFLLRRSHKPQQ